MALTIHNVPNANVYVDGVNWLGKAETSRLPIIKRKMGTHKGLGQVGEVHISEGGFEKMEAEFGFTSIDAVVARSVADPERVVMVQVRASIEVTEGGGLARRLPMVVTLRGTWSEYDLGEMKQHEGAKQKAKLLCNYVKQVIDGETVLEYDAIANIYVVNGEDKLAVLRRHLGV